MVNGAKAGYVAVNGGSQRQLEKERIRFQQTTLIIKKN
jgi:hypothetical protein